jgi:hypothetical protein
MRTANTFLAQVIADNRVRETHSARRHRLAREQRVELRKATRAEARRVRAERRAARRHDPNTVIDLREAERALEESKGYAEKRSSLAS